MTNKKIWAATLFSTLLLTMTISSPVKAAELQTSTTVDRSQITLPLSEETEENLFSLESVSDIQMSELVDPDEVKVKVNWMNGLSYVNASYSTNAMLYIDYLAPLGEVSVSF